MNRRNFEMTCIRLVIRMLRRQRSDTLSEKLGQYADN